MRKKIVSLLLAATMALSLTACGSDGGQTTATAETTEAGEQVTAEVNGDGAGTGTGETLTIYTNSGADGRGEWLQERAAQDGFDIQFIDAGAGDIQSRLVAEKNAPIADIAFGLNAIIWASLKNEGVLEQYVPVWADEVQEGLNDPDGYYHAIVRQAILLCYNKNKMIAEEAPKDWTDLWTNEAYDGKYEYLTGLGGGTVRIVLSGILTRYADPAGELGISDEGWEAIASYYEHGVPNESGVDLYAQMANMDNPVALGQMWSSGIESRDEQYGVDTAYVVPEIGVPYAVEGIAIIKGTKKAEEAKRFVDWFGSAEVQGEWAEEFSTLPANEKAVEKANAFNQEIAKIPAQDIDWDLVAENIDAWCEKILLDYMP